MPFLPTRIHGVIDYAMGGMLIILPFALRFPTQWSAMVPVGLGLGAILYSLMTDYELGAYPLLGMRAHLALDVASGLLLAASPWLVGFAPLIWMPHVILGALEVGVALVTQTTPALGPVESQPASVD